MAMTFTQQQCVEIMHPILSQGLPSARYIWSFPQAIVHGPWQWGGLNIPNLYMEQVITHLHTLMKFRGQLGDITGSLIQASWEALQLEAGLVGEITTFPEAIQDYLTLTWLSDAWAACQRSNIQIIGAQSPFTPKQSQDTKSM